MYVQLISNQSGSACPAGNCAVHRVPVLPVLHAALAHGTGCRGCAAERTLGRREKVGQGRPTRTGGLCHVSRNKKRKRAVSPHPDSTAAQRSLARAPFCACQARQQRSSNAVLHGLLVLLARGGSNTLGKHSGHPARRYGTAQILAVLGVPRAGASCGATWQSM